MSVATDLTALGRSLNAEVTDKGGVITLEIVLAERKAFLSKKKLTYIVKCRPDEGTKELNYSEMLKESGFGLSSGDSEAGVGFKSGTYKTGFGGPTQGTIQEQSALFGKHYSYNFDWSTVRASVEAIAKKSGYLPKYHVTML